ncbi:MAG: Rossmann-like and DUF2520 domain-containing protein [Bacteroidales bacterium]
MSHRIGFIGAGRVAWLLAPAFQAAGHQVGQVISRSAISAGKLGERLHCRHSNRITDLDKELEVIFLTVPDQVLTEVINDISDYRGLVVHTSGTFSSLNFACQKYRYGYLYPLQTFTVGRPIDLSDVPVFIEGSDPESAEKIQQLAKCLTNNIFTVSHDEKRRLHLAAVWASNFTNHLLAVAFRLMGDKGLPREWLYPLIRETFEKALAVGPERSQTGPAARQDELTIRKQMHQLSSSPELQELYRQLSDSILRQVTSNLPGK